MASLDSCAGMIHALLPVTRIRCATARAGSHALRTHVALWLGLAALLMPCQGQAQPTTELPNDTVAAELRLASQLETAGESLQPPRSLQARLRRAVEGPGGAPAETDAHATRWGTVGRARHRFLTMQVAGYTTAMLAAVLGVAGQMMRRTCSGPEQGPSDINALPYVAAPVFALGLSTGLVGSLRTLRLQKEHGDVARDRSGVGPFVAGFVSSVVIGGLGGAMAMSAVCFS